MEPEPTYTVFIRLPFPRGDFVDPPPVNWDSSKDERLWGILSGVSNTDIDCKAEKFHVTVDFLLRQATYLTERHAFQVRAQMRKATAAKGSSAPSPVPGSESAAAAEAMRRTGSGGGRAPSALSVRKDTPLSKNDGSIPGSPGKHAFGRPQISRNSSAATTVPGQRQAGSASPRPDKLPARPDGQRTRLSSLPITAANDSDTQSPGPAESSSESSSDSSSPGQSRIIRRPPRFQKEPDVGGSLADEDDEAEPAFLPLKAQQSEAGGSSHRDLGATLKGDPREAKRRGKAAASGKERAAQSPTSDSSTSSAAFVSKNPAGDKRPGPLSPRRTAELAGKSSAGKGKGYSREGSDGTPSMGSSFSDLDDASVTQSALEEALASKMGDGTIGSRMSNFSQAFRSRVMPKTNRP